MTPVETIQAVKIEVSNDSGSAEIKVKAIHRILDRYREHKKERHFEIAIGVTLVLIAFTIGFVFDKTNQKGPLTGTTILLVCAGITYLLSQFSGSIEVKNQAVKASGVIGLFVFCCLLMAYFSKDTLRSVDYENIKPVSLLLTSSAYADELNSSDIQVEASSVVAEVTEILPATVEGLEFKIVYPVGAGLKKATGIKLASYIEELPGASDVKVFSQGSRLYSIGNYFRDSTNQNLTVTYDSRATTEEKISEIINSMEYDFVSDFSFEEGKLGGTDVLIEIQNSVGNHLPENNSN